MIIISLSMLTILRQLKNECKILKILKQLKVKYF